MLNRPVLMHFAKASELETFVKMLVESGVDPKLRELVSQVQQYAGVGQAGRSSNIFDVATGAKGLFNRLKGGMQGVENVRIPTPLNVPLSFVLPFVCACVCVREFGSLLLATTGCFASHHGCTGASQQCGGLVSIYAEVRSTLMVLCPQRCTPSTNPCCNGHSTRLRKTR